jgi:hypothetical protein
MVKLFNILITFLVHLALEVARKLVTALGFVIYLVMMIVLPDLAKRQRLVVDGSVFNRVPISVVFFDL